MNVVDFAMDGSVGVWNASTGLQLAVMQCPQAAAVTHITLSHDLLRLLAAAVGATVSYAHLFDVASASLLASPAVRGSVRDKFDICVRVHARKRPRAICKRAGVCARA
jgi:hypothetical protein